MKVVLSRDAVNDLVAIVEWIAEDNIGRANSFADELQERCASLASHPRRFPVAWTSRNLEIRKLTYAGYLILYRVANVQVDILRIVHGSRDWASLFDGP